MMDISNMSYNDHDAMADFFANLQNGQSKNHWFVSHPDLAEKDRKQFEKTQHKASLVLDLHGATADSAHAQYEQIITFAARHQHRIVKMIHGVGLGIIKQELQAAVHSSPEILLATNMHAGKLSRSCSLDLAAREHPSHHRS